MLKKQQIGAIFDATVASFAVQRDMRPEDANTDVQVNIALRNDFAAAIEKTVAFNLARQQSITDRGREVLSVLVAHLEWDGHGYWLPEVCVAERDSSAPDSYVEPQPTAEQVIAAIVTKFPKKTS